MNVEETKKTIQSILKFRAEQNLLKESSEFNFVELKNVLNEFFDDLTTLNENFAELLNNIVEEDSFSNRLRQAQNYLERIATFNPHTTNNPSGERREIIRHLAATINQLRTQGLDRISIFRLKETLDSQELLKIKKKFQNQLNQFQEQSEEFNKKAIEALNAAEKAAQKRGTTAYVEVFKNQADEEKKSANRWLIGFIVTSLLLIIVTGLLFFKSINLIKNNPDLIWQIFITKIFIVSVFSTLLYQILKNYSAHMHLYKLNKHRHNCLSVFEAFSVAAISDSVKDSVLKEATHTIFQSGDTGFVSGKSENANTIELVKIIENIPAKK